MKIRFLRLFGAVVLLLLLSSSSQRGWMHVNQHTQFILDSGNTIGHSICQLLKDLFLLWLSHFFNARARVGNNNVCMWLQCICCRHPTCMSSDFHLFIYFSYPSSFSFALRVLLPSLSLYRDIVDFPFEFGSHILLKSISLQSMCLPLYIENLSNRDNNKMSSILGLSIEFFVVFVAWFTHSHRRHRRRRCCFFFRCFGRNKEPTHIITIPCGYECVRARLPGIAWKWTIPCHYETRSCCNNNETENFHFFLFVVLSPSSIIIQWFDYSFYE